MGTVHGGYISAILDSACGIAAHTGLKPGLGYTTLELKVSFLGRLVSMGGRAAFSEATLVNEKGQLCATATSTLLVFELRPRKAVANPADGAS